MILAATLLILQGGFDLDGESHWDGHGMQVFFLPDGDGDGVPEFATSAFCTDHRGFNSGSLYVYDGATRAVLRRHDGSGPNARLGEAAGTCGDVNGDGVTDYFAGARNDSWGGSDLGAVYVWSGADGTLLLRLQGSTSGGDFGWAAAGVGDVDGDGLADLLVGAPSDAGGRGRARLFSGANGAPLRLHRGSAPGGRFGTAVTGVGDADGDGVPDYAVGAPMALGERGRVTVHSGADGAVIEEHRGAVRGGRLGWRLAGVGDVDGDGAVDLLAGQPCADAVQVLRASGGVTRTHEGALDEGKLGFGHAVASAGDVDGDGYGDYLLGAPGEWEGFEQLGPGGVALLVSGRSGAVLDMHLAAEPDDGFGASVAGGTDLDGDGIPDLIIGAPAAGDLVSGHAPGRISVRWGRTLP